MIYKTKSPLIIFTFFVNLILLVAVPASYASDTLTITRGQIYRIPIAINTFDYSSKKEKDLSQKISDVINNNLRVSGMFHTIPSVAFLDNTRGINQQPSFAAWKQIDTNILVNSKLTQIDHNTVSVRFIIWDILSETIIAKEVFEFSPQMWRKVAHKISNRIYEQIIGERGYFESKIAYISERSNKTRIAIMDHDGENHKYLTDGKLQVLTPSFSPSGNKVLYVAYHNKVPMVHLKDLRSGQDSLLGRFNGISFAPCFSPDENKVLISISQFQSASTHIYEVNLTTKAIKKITNGNSINTSPCYSPDGQQIVFTSDRTGSPKLYVMNSDGSAVTKISHGSGTYTTPTWSPRGDQIAFTKTIPGEGFAIGVMNVDGENERIIAQGYLVEGPSWACNSRTIVFARTSPYSSKSSPIVKLYSIDATGHNEREMLTPYNGCDPDWSSN